jgi:hypothetical protein
MTTLWLSFSDPSEAEFLGLAIFDVDETARRLSAPEIVRKAHELGLNPGGQVCIREVGLVPEEFKNRLITDEALLPKPGSYERSNWSITLPTSPYITRTG